ncbi:zonular occludens toxin domain-containing protein [Methylococcus mesophilus]|uniref:zonular occludens toxin domain-containing protein n=1 Tax=Methylococcus mesophilus TaxID=2993564 RepID=UPI00224B89A8|nr:zonular occludens toxin domain-containing protein [Methylococcus mesophilus]UZR29443.1 hypothetical protein OOT43_02070 [Methylococcus mesophilus]
MITVITGSPGAGKTAFVVNELDKLPESRPLFVHAVPDLQVPHEAIYCKSSLCSHCSEADKPEGALCVEDWPSWAPIGAILFIDEVQRVWRPRASGSAVPESVAALETHRHRGVDFFLVSQGPHLFDGNVRKLVSRHVHLVAKWAGRISYEWPECKQNTDMVGDAVKRPYKLPKQVFGKYKSAEVHTKQNHAKPLAFYALLAMIPVGGFLGYKVYARIQAAIHPEEIKPTAPAAVPASPALSAVLAVPVAAPGSPVHDFKPRVEGRPETAPAYDGLYRVSRSPIVMGCVGTPDYCRCFTVKATRAEVSEPWCRAFLRREVFYPFEETRIPVPAAPVAASASPPALASSSVSSVSPDQQ